MPPSFGVIYLFCSETCSSHDYLFNRFHNTLKFPLANILFPFFRRKILLIMACSLFKSKSPPRKKKHHRLNQYYYQKTSEPNFRRYTLSWVKTSADWFKMLSQFASSSRLWKASFRNRSKRHWPPQHSLRVTECKSSKLRNALPIVSSKNKSSSKEMISKALLEHAPNMWRGLQRWPRTSFPLATSLGGQQEHPNRVGGPIQVELESVSESRSSQL